MAAVAEGLVGRRATAAQPGAADAVHRASRTAADLEWSGHFQRTVLEGLDTEFAANDHRAYNRHGEAFDVGETFSGVDYATGVRAASEFSQLAREAAPDATPAQVALAWVAAQDGVSTVIPGARNPEQARANAAAGSLELPGSFDGAVRELYDREIRASVHHRW